MWHLLIYFIKEEVSISHFLFHFIQNFARELKEIKLASAKHHGLLCILFNFVVEKKKKTMHLIRFIL